MSLNSMSIINQSVKVTNEVGRLDESIFFINWMRVEKTMDITYFLSSMIDFQIKRVSLSIFRYLKDYHFKYKKKTIGINSN